MDEDYTDDFLGVEDEGDTNWGNIGDAIGAGIGVVDDVICLIDPDRPGCPGDPNAAPDTIVNNYTTQSVPEWLYAVLGLMVIVVFYLLLKK